MNNIPDISSFQYDRAANGHMESSVNMYRGAVCFDYSIIELPKHENVGISVYAAYNSDIDKNIAKPNLESPTGILGLGWRLTYEKIECDKADIGKKPECRNYRITTGDNSGGGTPLHLIEEKDGCLYFESEIYDYSEIVYDYEIETWTITDQNGVKRLYGGEEGLLYAVLNGGRYTEAACMDDAGQSRGIKAWVLSEMVSLGGFTVKYGYDYVEQSVTGNSLTYTKAAYIKNISDSFGNLVEFEYGEKEWAVNAKKPREYSDPHKSVPSDSFDYYQSEYETKYLSQISVSNKFGALYSVKFEYELKNYNSIAPVLGDTAKRMLKSIQMVTAKGKMPDMQFEYNSQKEANPGALKRILYPEGGITEYSYGQNQQLTMSNRTQIISNSGFSEATKTFFGRDYAVVFQRNAEKVRLSIYEWIGRWQKYTPDVSLDGIDPETVEVHAMERYCIVASMASNNMKAKYYVFTRQRKVKGGWKASPPETLHTLSMKIIAGDKWFFVHDTDKDVVTCYYYDEPRETWEKGTFPDEEGKDGYARFFAACDNRVFCFAYDETGGGRKNNIAIYECSPLHIWTKLAETSDSSIALKGGSDGDYYLAFDGWLAAGAFVYEKAPDTQRYTLGVWRYDGDSKLDSAVQTRLSIPVSDPSYIAPRIAGNTVISAGYLYRFCGNTWETCKSLAISAAGNYQFALSEDIALCSFVTENTRQIKGAIFDKANRVWKVQTLLQSRATKIPACGVSISGNIAVCADTVYDIRELSFDKKIEALEADYGSAVIFNNGICIVGSVYGQAEDDTFEPRSAYIHTIKNGVVVDKTVDSRIFDENCGGYGNIFSLSNSDSDIKLLFAGEGRPDEPVTFYQATGVKLNDGVDVIVKKYRYDTSLTACDESGQYARYAKVEVINGTDNEDNKSVYRFADSVSSFAASDNAEKSSVADGTLISVESYLNGRLDNQLTAEYEFTNVVGEKIIYGAALAKGVLTQNSEIDKNGQGVSRVTEFTVDLLSGEQRELVSYNYNIKGKKETHKHVTVFAYEKYPELKEQHRFSEVCENIRTINEETVSHRQRDYDSVDGFFSEKTMMLIGPEKAGNKVLYDITGRGTFGAITAKKGVFPEYFVFDQTGCFRVAEFTNCGLGECFAYCFEEYEVPLFDLASSESLTDSVCYAGTRCMEIKAGKSSSPITHSFRSSGIDYGFSFYAQCNEGCILHITAKGRTLDIPITEGTFSYQLVDLREFGFAEGEDTQIEFVFENDSDTSLFIDIISFFPLLHPPHINVYYSGGALLAASLSGYGDITETVYDEIGRVVYMIGNKKVINAQIPSFMRETGDTVNSELTFQNAGDGQYVKRVAAIKSFKPSLKLSENFCVMFFCSGNVNINMGEAIWIERNDSQWTFLDKMNNVSQTISCEGNLIAILFSEIVALTVNGKVLFSYRQSKKMEASFEVTSSEEILNFAIGNDPISGITYSDGAGKCRQEHWCADGRTCVTAKSYDSMGRECAVTVPTYFEQDYLKYIPDYIKEIDAVTGAMTGIVSERNTDCENYPYYAKSYEKRSGGRIKENGLPGRAYAVNEKVDPDNRHTVRTSYSKDVSCIPMLDSKLPYYTVMTVCDPDDNKMMTVYDLQKNKIATAVKIGEEQLVTVYMDEYKDAVRTVSVTMPNGNVKKTYYDFAGNLIERSDVNSGHKKFVYDSTGHLRFTKDAVYEQDSFCKYCIYDELYRITEEGICQALSDEELSRKALDPSFPESDKVISRRYYYDGDYSLNEIGMLTKVEIFGETEENKVVSTISISVDKSAHSVIKTISMGEESYQTKVCYDNFGNVISDTGTDGRTTNYAYDYASRIKSVSRDGSIVAATQYRADGLPTQVVSCGNTVTYKYDTRGKVVSIDSPFYKEKVVYLEGDQFYNGKIRSVEAEIKGAKSANGPMKIKYDLDYDESGRLLSAVCGEHSEYSLTNLQYDGNGNILSCKAAGAEQNFSLNSGTDQLASVGTSEYEYDGNGAVTRISKKDEPELTIEYYKYSGLPKRFKVGETETEVLYDENNRRLRKTVLKNGKLQNSNVYIYDGIKLSEEIRAGKALKYIHGANGLNAVSYDGIDYSVIADRLGYTRVVAECEKIIQAYHYKPFGEVIKVISESELVHMLFGNYELDGETGLYYAKSRMFDPYAYRFLSPDPEGEFPSPYVFCGNDPFALIDENGERSWYAALIGMVFGIVLTVGLSVLTMGSAAPVATAVFGTGGSSVIAGATSAAQTAAIVAYNTVMSAAVTAVSGIASEGLKSLIDGEPYTASSVYDTLLNAAASGLVFGGAGTLLSSVGKFAIGADETVVVMSRKYVSQGIILGLVNAGVSAAISPVNDLISGEAVSGIGVLESAGFGALSGGLTTFATVISDSETLNISRDIVKESVNDIIWAGADPGTYYGMIMEITDSTDAEQVYDKYSVGAKTYVLQSGVSEAVPLKNEQIVKEYACFGNSGGGSDNLRFGNGGYPYQNIISPRYFVTRGFGPKLV